MMVVSASSGFGSQRRWAILLTFMLNCGFNAFMFMDFTSVPTLTKQVFGFCPLENATACTELGDDFVGWTYSAGLLAVCPALVLVMVSIERFTWATYTIGLTCQCIGGWLRYVAVYTAVTGADPILGRDIAYLSSIFIGFGAGACCVGYSALPGEWFLGGERALATSCTVQSNYMGWAAGAMLFPYAVSTAEELVSLQFTQAIGVSFAFGSFLMVYQTNPDRHAQHVSAPKGQLQESAAGGGGGHGFLAGMHSLCTNPQYVLQSLAYGCMAGVSFGVPAFQATAFHALGLTEKDSAWTNLAFIGTGVVTGLTAGKLCTDPRRYPIFIKSMFVIASIGLVATVVTTFIQEELYPSTLYTLLIVEMMVCGSTTLGFIGIGLAAVVETTHPVSSELSGGTVELFVQVFGAAFAEGGVLLGERAFMLCGVAAWVVTAVMLYLHTQSPEQVVSDDCFERLFIQRDCRVWYKQEYRKSESEGLGGPRGYSTVSRASASAPCCGAEDEDEPADSPQASLLANGSSPKP